MWNQFTACNVRFHNKHSIFLVPTYCGNCALAAMLSIQIILSAYKTLSNAAENLINTTTPSPLSQLLNFFYSMPVSKKKMFY